MRNYLTDLNTIILMAALRVKDNENPEIFSFPKKSARFLDWESLEGMEMVLSKLKAINSLTATLVQEWQDKVDAKLALIEREREAERVKNQALWEWCVSRKLKFIKVNDGKLHVEISHEGITVPTSFLIDDATGLPIL